MVISISRSHERNNTLGYFRVEAEKKQKEGIGKGSAWPATGREYKKAVLIAGREGKDSLKVIKGPKSWAGLEEMERGGMERRS